jgi:hypothetical protein
MRLQQIQNNYLHEDLDAIVNTSRRSIFESIGQGDAYFTRWEKEIHPVLCEVALTPDQIQQLFTTVEKGSDRTLLGKGLDAAGAAKDKISDVWFNKFGGMLQSSGPVKAFDAQYDKLVSSIAKKYPEIAAKVKKYQAWAKENPNLQKFLLAIVGSVAAALGVAAAGGIAAGALAIGTGTAIAVGIVNIADRLLKGEKASTAIGRGATAGLVAGITAAGAAKLADLGKDLVAQIGVMKGAGEGVEKLNIIRDAVGTPGMPGFEGGIQIAGKTEDIAKLRDLWDQFGKLAWDYKPGTDPSALYGPYKEFAGLVAQMKDPAYIDGLQLVAAQQDQAIQWINSAFDAINGATKIAATAGAATAGQAAGGAGEKPAPKESFTANGKKLSEGQVYMIFNRTVTQQLNEGPIWDKVKGVAGKGIDKLKTAGKNLTTSVTADKLNSAWKKAGSPTDSEEVAKVLTTAGVSNDNVKKIYTDLKLPAPGAAAETPAELDSAALEKMIASMTAKDKKRLAQYITKQLGTA